MPLNSIPAPIQRPTQYHPFGMLMEDTTNWRQDTSYRFGFNGQEQDNEISGIGNSLDFGARLYNSSLGRWFKKDPAFQLYPDFSNYSFALDNPIIFSDHFGRTITIVVKPEGNREEGASAMIKMITSGMNDKVIVEVDASKSDIYGEALKMSLKPGVVLTTEEQATYNLLQEMMTNDESYEIFAGITNETGFNAPDDWSEMVLYINAFMELPDNTYSETDNYYNKLWVLYHFFAEQQAKYENLATRYLNDRIYQQRPGAEELKDFKDKQCAATCTAQLQIWGFYISPFDIKVLGDGVTEVDLWSGKPGDRNRSLIATLVVSTTDEGTTYSYKYPTPSPSPPKVETPHMTSSEDNSIISESDMIDEDIRELMTEPLILGTEGYGNSTY